ncbi:MAG: hypothetical protein BEN19_02110 [Epulopiscium sp. Nuni2H_MBin003]|nr:MAG: hypothetical protein BEN19_02110 [Epulopiscium sp. Nuni2H_MBin003]
MVVALTQELTELKQYLTENTNYKIIDLDLSNKTEGIHALIYDTPLENVAFEEYQEQLRNISLDSETNEYDNTLLLLSAKNKTPSEIKDILDSRFTNIFK